MFTLFGGFADCYAVEDSRVSLPGAPGIRFELKADLWTVMRKLAS